MTLSEITKNTLIGLSCSLALMTIALCLLVLIVVRNRKTVSVQLIIHFSAAMFSIILCFPFSLHILLGFEGEGTLYSMPITFWTGTIYSASLFSMSLSIFFMTWDRIFTICFPLQFSSKQRNRLAALNIVSEVFIMLYMFYLVSDVIPDSDLQSTCMYWGCSTANSNGSVRIWPVNITLSCGNIVSGLLFYGLFWRNLRQRGAGNAAGAKKGNVANHTALAAVFIELFYRILPQGVSQISLKVFDVVLMQSFGPYLVYFHAAEVLTMAIVYYMRMRNRSISKNGGWLTNVRKSLVVKTQATTAFSSSIPQ